MAADSSGRTWGRGFALVLGWSALWGCATGMCVLGPLLVRSQHVRPDTPASWLLVVGALLAASTIVCLVVSVPAGLLLEGYVFVRRRTPRDLGWATALASPPLLVPSYVLAGALAEWLVFKSWLRLAGQAPYLVLTAAGSIAAGVAFRMVYRRIVAREPRPSVGRLVRALGIVVVLGTMTLPLRAGALRAVARGADVRLVRRTAGAAGAAPFLLVGVDSANWATLGPLLAAGRLPTIARLVDTGAHGVMRALWPPYWSAPAWGAIVTGHSQDENGWYGDMSFQIRGLPTFETPVMGDLALDPFFLVEGLLVRFDVAAFTHPPRRVLETPPVWELLSRAGVDTAVLRFDFTYPAAGGARFLVSNRVGHDAWSLGGFARAALDGDVASSEARAAGLLDVFRQPLDRAGFAKLLPDGDRPRPRDAVVDVFEVLRLAFDTDQKTLLAAERLVRRRPDLPVLMVYLPGFDEACHAFWQYRFPDAYGVARPAEADIAELGPVVDRYLEFLDAHLGRVLDAYGTPPNVMLVSDHGHRPVFDHFMWRGWHDDRGVFLAAGPAFSLREEPLAVSYFDVVPTIAELTGFDPPPGLAGRSLLAPAGLVAPALAER